MSGVNTDPFGHAPELPDDPDEPFEPPAVPAPAGTPWPLWTAIVAVITALVVGNVLGGIVIAVAGASGVNTDDLPVAWSMIANAVFQLSLLGTALFFARTYGGLSADRLGWRTARFWPSVGWALLALVAYYVFQAVWISALNLQNETDDITNKLQDHPTTATVALIAVFAVVVAPIVEETFFRGYVFTALRTSLPTGWAALITGVIFGAVHGFGSPIGFLPPLAVLGAVLCLVYWKTRSLLPCIALHLTNNAIALTVALDWTWQGVVLWAGAMLAAAGLVLPWVHVTRSRDRIARIPVTDV